MARRVKVTNSLHLFDMSKNRTPVFLFRPSTGIESVLIGDRFLEFLPRYWAAIGRCSTVIDQVVIAHAKCHETVLRSSIPSRLGVDVRLVPIETDTYGAHCHNQGINQLETEWVMFLGIDDQILEGGLDDLPAAHVDDAEILVAGIKISDGNEWVGEWNLEKMKVMNPLPAHSPYRKSLWEKVGGAPSIKWIDWGFWALAAVAGAKTYQSNKLVAILDIGDNHETESGKSITAADRARFDAEFHEFAKSIGF